MYSYEDMHCKMLHYFEPITDYREMANAMSFAWNSTFAHPNGSGRKFHKSLLSQSVEIAWPMVRICSRPSMLVRCWALRTFAINAFNDGFAPPFRSLG